MNFLFEIKNDNAFSFFGVKICREKHTFTTSIFIKDTFSDGYTSFSSFTALEYKFVFIKALLHRRFIIVSNFIIVPNDKIFAERPAVTTVPKLEIRIVLPCLGSISSITKTRLTRCIGKRLKFCKLKFVFQTSNKLKNYIRFNDRVSETLQSNFLCSKLPITVKPTDIRSFGFQNTRVFLPEQVSVSEVLYPRHLETTC